MGSVRTFKRGKTWYLDIHDPSLPRGRVKFSTELTTKVEVDREVRKLQARIDAGLPVFESKATSFAEVADRYCRQGLGHLAATTRRSHKGRLEGGLTTYFGEMAVDEISHETLVRWWRESIEGGDKKLKTGLNYLDALSGLFWFLEDEGTLKGENPVPKFRKMLRRRRGKEDRAQGDPAQDIRVIEKLEDIASLLAAAEKAIAKELPALARAKTKKEKRGATQRIVVSRRDRICVLLATDAGLRMGEVAGIRWQDIWWGKDDADTHRHLFICNTNPGNGDRDEAPKGGPPRKVALSLRLRSALRERWMQMGQPEEGYIAPGFDHSNFRRRFLKLCTDAKLDAYRPKDLRSTYASHLLTLGIPLTYIAKQLGHTSPELTRRRYARYIPDDYLAPPPLQPGQVPADLLAQAGEEEIPASEKAQR